MARLEGYLTSREVALVLDISRCAVNRLYGRGTLPGVKVGDQNMFRVEAVKAYLRDEVAQKRSRRGRLLGSSNLDLLEVK